MYNWVTADKNIVLKTFNAAMGEIETLLDAEYDSSLTANYWLDARHNIFAIVDSSNDEMWVELHYELYDANETLIGDLMVIDTRDMSRDAVEEEVMAIVKEYYGE